jgi:type II secretory pathway pseudopilin PulG
MRHALIQRRGSAAYTLVEMAVALGVAGILLASALSIYRVYLQQSQFARNRDNINRVFIEIDSYAQREGGYPCPARLDLAQNDTNYGMPGDCANTAVAAGNCANGVCVERTARTDIGPARARRGMIPFRILNLPEDMAYDAYHNRLQYAVTESLTLAHNFDANAGAISVIDSMGSTVIPGAHFVLFSTGPDNRGAYTLAGVMKRPCDITAADGENCNASASGAIYRLGRFSPAQGAAHYDDDLRIYSATGPVWRKADPDGVNIVDNSVIANGGTFGIGREAGGTALSVQGDVLTSGRYYGDYLCSLDGGFYDSNDNCFSIRKLANGGPAQGMECPAGQYATRIWGGGADPSTGKRIYGRMECGPFTGMYCPQGEFIVGIYGDGARTRFSCSAYTP